LVNVIRLAVYELVYCPLTPVHAIVHEAVEVVKGSAGPRQTGFVNAVLREVTRHIVDRQGRLAEADSRQLIPTDAERGCLFDAAFLPGPKAVPHEYLAVCFSLPVWLMQDWIARFGYQSAWEVALASNRRPSVYLRPNPIRTTPVDLVARLSSAGIEAEAGEGGAIRLSSAGAVEQIPGYKEGLFSVQDPTAARVVDDLRPASGESILDLCSAPGGKTIQIAEQTGDQARIVATDSNPERLDKVRENIARLGLSSVTLPPYGEIQGYVDFHGPFDAVLLDVPCSNTGVLARRVEVRYRLQSEVVPGLTRTQGDLLEQAASWVKPEGRIVYSTCSIQPPENEDVVQAFLGLHPEFRLKSQRLTLPSASPMDHDGGYVAVLQR
jgi:16S rRNA (cytosine967-C5)-methyltransferase